MSENLNLVHTQVLRALIMDINMAPASAGARPLIAWSTSGRSRYEVSLW